VAMVLFGKNNIAKRLIGADIDEKAISEAKKIISEVDLSAKILF